MFFFSKAWESRRRRRVRRTRSRCTMMYSNHRTNGYPLVICDIAIENGPVEIVDFPMKNGGSFHGYVNVYQRVIPNFMWIPSMAHEKIMGRFFIFSHGFFIRTGGKRSESSLHTPSRWKRKLRLAMEMNRIVLIVWLVWLSKLYGYDIWYE